MSADAVDPAKTTAPSPPGALAGREEAALRWRENLQGAGWMILSCLAATAMSIAVKALSEALPTPMIVFLRCLLGLVIVLPMALDGSLARLRLTRPWMHLLRGALMGAALNFGFYSLATLNLTTATILLFLAPVFATMLAVPVLGQQVGALRWAAVGAGFLGAVIILRPGLEPLNWGMLAAIAGAACFAASLMISSIIAKEDGPRSVLITSTAVATVVTLPLAAPVWTLPDTLGLWVWVGLLVLFSSSRMYADIQAYAKGEAGFVAPFAYLRLLFVALAAWIMFAQIPESHALLGGAVIVGSTLFIAYRERKLGLRVSSGAAA